MASISLPGMTRWGNPYSRLPGALGPSPSHGGDLVALFFFGHRGACMVDHRRPQVWPSPVFPHLVSHDVPVQSRCLGRPRLLTCLSPRARRWEVAVLHKRTAVEQAISQQLAHQGRRARDRGLQKNPFDGRRHAAVRNLQVAAHDEGERRLVS